MEKTLVSTMVLGMLALMIHLWVCTMRFFQYYLDTLIRESPNILLEMTTAGLLGGQEVVPLGPLTKFLKQQQPQIHITVCWFLSLCYADYVRKHYCTRFNMPYLEQWQTELHERATASAHRTMRRVHSFVESAQQRLRGFAQPESTPSPSEIHTVRAQLPKERLWSAEQPATCHGEKAAAETKNWEKRSSCQEKPNSEKMSQEKISQEKTANFVLGSSASRARQLLMLLKNLECTSTQPDVPARVRNSPGNVELKNSVRKKRKCELLDYTHRYDINKKNLYEFRPSYYSI
ncbi:uncharacterized protein LOC128674988 isoform X2 [Plodia interpunctella]|nr:uncharacterized protein LOC128674988 isoform X2 [Plodia interpunctella]